MTDLTALAETLIAEGESAPRIGRDPVNLPMIRNWLEALGDANPTYEASEVAPPAMIQVWTMRGLHRSTDDGDPLGVISQAFADAGYPSIVATNCEQTYHRYLRVGEEVSVRSRLVSVVGPKRTGLGEGWFITTESTWYAGDEAVATMMFRVLRYRAAPPPDSSGLPGGVGARNGASTPPSDLERRPLGGIGAPNGSATPPSGPGQGPVDVIRPVVSPDTAFFWEGMRTGELRIQRCEECGRLRHPPGPACPACGSLQLSHVVSAGKGTVYSYVVHHYPAVPGRSTPFVVALVELAEGVRMLGQLLDADPDAVQVGAPVEFTPERVDDELALPAWRLSTVEDE